MDLLMVRKIGVPGHEELALGAVVDEPAPQLTINEAIRESCGIGDAELAELESRQLQEIARRRALYLHGRAPVAIEGSTAIIVDDGMATGATVKAALSAVRAQHPAELILAIGVAPPEQLGMLYPEVTDIICLHQPDPFHSVGFYYQDFSEVSDQEVVDLLDSVGDRG
jgi:putative phosphoribosyl transferase